MYQYAAQCRKVIDGDTLIVDIQIGFGILLQAQKIRLAQINAPEVDTQAGKQSYEYLRSLIEGKPIILTTLKASELGLPKEKYGRWLAVVIYENSNINQHLLALGYAKPY
jgi:micrococcal nuclease